MSKRTTVGRLAIGVMFIAQLVRAQEPEQSAEAASITTRVDKIFEKWDKPDSPGCAIAVIKDGRITIYGSVGLAFQDLVVGWHVYQQAKKANVGNEIMFLS